MILRQNRRHRRLIEPRLQLRFGVLFLTMAGIAALMQSLVMTWFLTRFAADLPADGLALRMALPGIMGKAFLTTFCLLAPLMLALGVRAMFRVVGPIHRFRTYLRELARGKAAGPCTLRRGDELGDLCQVLNEATAPLRAGSEAEADRAA